MDETKKTRLNELRNKPNRTPEEQTEFKALTEEEKAQGGQNGQNGQPNPHV